MLETNQSNRDLLTMTGNISKSPETQTQTQKSTKCVSEILFEMILRYGCMDIVISDQSGEFVNKVCSILSILGAQ
jgi:hypothetical protein